MIETINRVVSLYDHKTCIKLAKIEWKATDKICEREHIKRKKLFELILKNKNKNLNLSASIRLFTSIYYFKLNMLKLTKKSPHRPIFEAIKGII